MDELPFWKRKTLAEMTSSEWESLCDGCGLCCLNKIENGDSGDIYFTEVRCKLMDGETCRCTSYPNRWDFRARLRPADAGKCAEIEWLPRPAATGSSTKAATSTGGIRCSRRPRDGACSRHLCPRPSINTSNDIDPDKLETMSSTGR